MSGREARRELSVTLAPALSDIKNTPPKNDLW
jgi:hypothetical protein